MAQLPTLRDSTGQATQTPKRPNEEAIFAAALEAFGAHGFNGASMRDIAARAGTSLSNLYNYVPAKADLLAKVLQRANEDLRSSLEAALAVVPSGAAQRLAAVVRAYVLWSVRQQLAGVVALGEFRYLQGPQREQVVEARDSTQRIIGSIVEEGVRSGEFLTPYPHESTRSIALLCAALATWFRPSGEKTADHVAEEQAHLALAMVEANMA
jgi:TetR/AcrR family transcriptional regulator, cholesterol catabolism regulator